MFLCPARSVPCLFGYPLTIATEARLAYYLVMALKILELWGVARTQIFICDKVLVALRMSSFPAISCASLKLRWKSCSLEAAFQFT